MEIVPLDERHAAAAADLLNVLEPEFVTTSRSLLYRERAEPARAHRRAWVAAERGGDVVGFATASFDWTAGSAEVGRARGGVRDDRRSRGIGSELLRVAESHLLEHGARRLQVRAERDSAGARFAAASGYTLCAASEALSVLDPRSADLSELDTLTERAAEAGYRLVPLGELRDRGRDLFDFYRRAEAFPPGNAVIFDDWRGVIFEHPELAFEGSFAVLADEKLVAVALLTVDGERARAQNEWTGTLPGHRGRGLARLAKLATLRWAHENGIREIRTENDVDNAAMLAVNRRLGYRHLAIRDDLERPA